MFDLSIEKIVVLVLVALFVLGPERLPAAAAWVGKAVRQAKSFAANANAQIQREIGPEFDQLRQPLAELRALRDPRRAVLDHLFAEPAAASTAGGSAADTTSGTAAGTASAAGEDRPVARSGALPVIDVEAT